MLLSQILDWHSLRPIFKCHSEKLNLDPITPNQILNDLLNCTPWYFYFRLKSPLLIKRWSPSLSDFGFNPFFSKLMESINLSLFRFLSLSITSPKPKNDSNIQLRSNRSLFRKFQKWRVDIQRSIKRISRVQIRVQAA